MSDQYVSPSEYPAIRAAIDITMTDLLIPDRIIELPIFLAQSRIWLAQKIVTVTSPTDDQKKAFTNAVIYYCASLLIPSVPQILQEQHANNQSYQRSSMNWDAKAADLRSKAELAVSEAIDSNIDPTSLRPPGFILASGTRGY